MSEKYSRPDELEDINAGVDVHEPHTHNGHTHVHEHHSDSHDGHVHSHVHDKEETRAVVNRLSRAIGHLESVKRMVEDDRDCSEVLIQLSAVRSAITNAGKILMKSHIEHCIVEAIQNDEPERIEELKYAIDRFVK